MVPLIPQRRYPLYIHTQYPPHPTHRSHSPTPIPQIPPITLSAPIYPGVSTLPSPTPQVCRISSSGDSSALETDPPRTSIAFVWETEGGIPGDIPAGLINGTTERCCNIEIEILYAFTDTISITNQ